MRVNYKTEDLFMCKKGCSLILLSGGVGTRMNNNTPKQYMQLGGKPIIMHILERVDDITNIDEVIIVCKDEYIKIVSDYINNYHLTKNYRFASSGNTRQESVYNGLKVSNFNTVIIHEAARPFVKKEEFAELLNTPELNVTYGSPINYTVLTCSNNFIDGILERDKLVNIQLPQKFDKELLLESHKKAQKDGFKFTEDASLLFHYNTEKIAVIRGKDYNIKITTPEDIIIAEKIYKEFFIGR